MAATHARVPTDSRVKIVILVWGNLFFFFSIPAQNFSTPFFLTKFNNKKNCHVSAMWINVKIMVCALTTIMVVQRARVSTVIRARIVRQVRF